MCAQMIAKDLSVWLAANRERIGGKEWRRRTTGGFLANVASGIGS
jgi:hypothetical protein